ncbi:cyanophycin synthetase [Rhizobium leguminosarum bv. trifolii]|uniref:cyanophycin synthetase n=1 Tax=Rhizobium leguminosarum TaxID=384 RepID=UPI000E2EC054|nr:cyanophycin synthetase [Rhizobium leguminosarum]RFB88783.1 cyanophycin synthetase [Rhizobium leguminosarum bv. trifolii]
MNPLNTVTSKRAVRPMDVREAAVYRGPHLYSRTPMIRIQLNLGTLEKYPTDRLPGFAETLTQLLPGLQRHGCCYGEPGGFLLRLRDGTWLGHVVEHVAIELQNMVGADVARGKTRSVSGETGVYNVMFAYQDEEVGLLAGRFALELVDSLLPPKLQGVSGADQIAASSLEIFELAGALKALRSLHLNRAFGPTTASLIKEAESRDIPWRRLDSSSLVQLGYGKHLRRIRASCSSLTSEIATEIASDKDLTGRLLHEAGLPVPRSMIVDDADAAVRAARQLGFPVVTKPVDGNHGRGVNVGLTSEDQVTWGFLQAQAHSSLILVEQQLTGLDHRILVVGGKIAAAAKRVPAHVIGDGRSSIQKLIEQVNLNPRRGEGHEAALTKIVVDDCLVHFIAQSGLDLSSVPASNQRVVLLPTANLSTGGIAVDCTEDIHPDNAFIACRAAQIVGLDIAGIDFIAPDIGRSVIETGGGIIEVNAGPGFRMHLYPSQGRPRNVAKPVLNLLYPEEAPSRVPIFAVTGTNGKTTTARMLAHILSADGRKVGLTTSTGIYIDGRLTMSGDCTGPKSARLILSEPTIDVAVLETARGGILREGLGFDGCHVGCVTNVASDHLGMQGIETVEDLAGVKSVVVESVRRGGWSILNADNSHTAAMREEAGGELCYFTTQPQDHWPDFLKSHVREGGRAVVCDLASTPKDILLFDGGQMMLVTTAENIPATLGGLAGFNVDNALAAAAMAYCGGVALPVICRSLGSFGATFEQSPGRLNIIERDGFKIIVDYAHNPEGLRALGSLVDKLKAEHARCIGVIGIAGDRRDQDIVEMGTLAGRLFDRLILKEDDDPRGRPAGEAAAILMEGARRAGTPLADMEIVLSERRAVDKALAQALPNDLIVIAADDIGRVWHQVSRPGRRRKKGAFVQTEQALTSEARIS